MVKRKRLGIRYDFNYNTATGAAIFFQNIIKTLNVLPDEKKPEVYVFVSPDAPVADIKAIDYPYLQVLPIRYLPVWKRAINRLYRRLSSGPKFNLFNAPTYTGEPLDGIVSLVIPSEDIAAKKQLVWIADLQLYHLPENYTQKEIDLNKALEERTVKGRHDIVLCSQWVIDDFNRLFPGHQCKTHRLRFATLHPDFSHEKIEQLREQYQLPADYFIVSNQFWVHKNHMAVCKAVHALKEKYPDICVLFTGNTRTPDEKTRVYIEGLHSYIKENGLEKNIRFLGLIPRTTQLCLMKNSLAIIQPSFFESWNTTVEDAKLLGKFLILSDLPVHREQISENVFFFNPDKAEELEKAMQLFLEQGPGTYIPQKDYNEHVKEFAEAVVGMME